MKLHVWLFALAFVPAVATAALPMQGTRMTAEEEVRALIGIEYSIQRPWERLVGHLSCIDGGGGILQIGGVDHEEWAYGRVECRGRQVLMLKRSLSRKEGKARWRVVDTLLLPLVLLDRYVPDDPINLWLFTQEWCTLDGRYDTDFVALVRWSEREQIDWRSGVEHAWTYDLERKRIVPISTKRIVCEQPIVD